MIQVIEKPSDISWDKIHDVLYLAHSVNRMIGVNQVTSNYSGELICAEIGDGKCFVAMDGDNLVGTCAVRIKKTNAWFAKGYAAYYMFAGVIPEYQGKGIYSLFEQAREEYVRNNNIHVRYLSTSANNLKLQRIRKKDSFHLVRFYEISNSGYYSVILVKWDEPPTLLYVKFRYLLSKFKTIFRHYLKQIIKMVN